MKFEIGKSSKMAEIQLPDGFQELKTQVAGHTFEAANAKAVGLLLDAKTGCVLKPLGKPECGERETKFYETIKKALNNKNDDQLIMKNKVNDDAKENDLEIRLLIELNEYVPRFYQKLQLKVNQRELMFLQMENLVYGMMKPCIMDIKIGQRTWDPLATEEKRVVEEQKYLGSKKPLGLCLPGFQLYKYPNGDFVKHSKDYGKKLNVEGFRDTITMFLNAEKSNRLCKPLINEVLKQLYDIRSWFRKQSLLHFYASSLLIAYDYDVLMKYFESEPNDTYLINGHIQHGTEMLPNKIIPPAKWIKVKMIDFAHVFPAEGQVLDINYLFGLENLIKIVEDI